MSWGYKILIFYGLFVSGILFLVYKSSRERIDLVATDYYEQELKYQDKINEAARAAALSEPVTVEMRNDTLCLDFHHNFTGKTITGELDLYYAADKKRDISKTFTQQAPELLLPVPAINKGQHTVKLNWSVENVTYYLEKNVFIR